MASQNAEYMKKINDNVENIYELLKDGILKVSVQNYGLVSSNTPSSDTGMPF